MLRGSAVTSIFAPLRIPSTWVTAPRRAFRCTLKRNSRVLQTKSEVLRLTDVEFAVGIFEDETQNMTVKTEKDKLLRCQHDYCSNLTE
jgi:hypothetical protein